MINDLVDNVYVLNLEEDIFKYEILKRKLDQKNIEHERFVGTGRQHHIKDSVRGQQSARLHYEVELFLEIAEKYKDSEFFEHVVKAAGYLFSNGGGAFRSGGATGCRISHLRIIEDAIENNYENILMLQDDIFFHKDFEYMLHKHSDLIKQSDIFWLGASEYDTHLKENRWKNPNWNYYKGRESTYGKWVYQPTSRTFGWYSVYLNKKIFKELLELLKLKLFSADQCLNLISQAKYKNSSWVAYPNLIISDTLHSKTWKDVSFESGWVHRPIEQYAEFKGWDLDYYDLTERYYEVQP
jgi:GR25 family glycosyltransferase involved in LPS biosynthesis